MSFNLYNSKVSELVPLAQSSITGCHGVHGSTIPLLSWYSQGGDRRFMKIHVSVYEHSSCFTPGAALSDSCTGPLYRGCRGHCHRNKQQVGYVTFVKCPFFPFRTRESKLSTLHLCLFVELLWTAGTPLTVKLFLYLQETGLGALRDWLLQNTKDLCFACLCDMTEIWW